MKRITLVLLTLALTLPVLAQAPQGPTESGNKRKPRGGKQFKKLDKNNDHQISRDEWTRKPKAFDRLDQNHDGILTDVELKQRRNGQNPR